MRVARNVEEAKLPTRKHVTDAGLDLYSAEEMAEMIHPGDVKIIRTGIVIELPAGYAGYLWPKSRSDLLIGGGVIDSGYRGEILVKVINPTRSPMRVDPGDAIAQLVIVKTETPKIEEVSYNDIILRPTERGATGGIVSQLQLLNGPEEF